MGRGDGKPHLNNAAEDTERLETLYVVNAFYSVSLKIRKCCSYSGQFTTEEPR